MIILVIINAVVDETRSSYIQYTRGSLKEIDFEKLRKTLVRRQAINAIFIGTHAATNTTNNIYDATPEQLINYARRAGINLDKFKLNK